MKEEYKKQSKGLKMKVVKKLVERTMNVVNVIRLDNSKNNNPIYKINSLHTETDGMIGYSDLKNLIGKTIEVSLNDKNEIVLINGSVDI